MYEMCSWRRHSQAVTIAQEFQLHVAQSQASASVLQQNARCEQKQIQTTYVLISNHGAMDSKPCRLRPAAHVGKALLHVRNGWSPRR